MTQITIFLLSFSSSSLFPFAPLHSRAHLLLLLVRVVLTGAAGVVAGGRAGAVLALELAVDASHVERLEAALGLLDVKADLLALGEVAVALHLDGALVHKHLLGRLLISLEETVPLTRAEPLDRAGRVAARGEGGGERRDLGAEAEGADKRRHVQLLRSARESKKRIKSDRQQNGKLRKEKQDNKRRQQWASASERAKRKRQIPWTRHASQSLPCTRSARGGGRSR